MPGRGPAPKTDKVTRHVPTRGTDTAAATDCWAGEVPAPPDGLMPASTDAWATWFAAWFAAFWKPSDLPALRQMVRLYDQVERGEFQRATELRLLMDTYGVTPKGQQDRRWKPADPAVEAKPKGTRYGNLRAV